ncbi:MAG TPA: GH92 family glycosyl hydrolase, partial [Bacteroidales bacterium]|nr:GH92 family glycosyl hydrolase [Bacteroidales bacterium]
YYSVMLDDYQILAELTASERVGYHRYSYEGDDSLHIILDAMANIYHHDNKNVWTFIRVENDTLVTGYRQTNGWARTRKVYFAMAFSRPITEYGHKRYEKVTYNGFYRRFDQEHNFPEMAGRDIRAWFTFAPDQDKPLEIKFALSPVSSAGALKNMAAEIPGWDFEALHEETRARWNAELGKIKIEALSQADKTVFYTALYHTMLSPIIYEDVDGQYMGLDQNVHHSEGFVNYTIFSLWDTFRALHPLFNLIQAERNNDMVKSMLAHYDQSVHPMLPIWSHYANENWCMIGYHSVPVLADAIAKKTTDAPIEKILAACVTTSTTPYFDAIDSYMELGYVPADRTSSSVSKTLEFAYDDWCIAQIAEKAGNNSIRDEYLGRASYYRAHYDKGTGFMRPKKSDGSWVSEFDPLDTHGQGFIEGNAWTYSLFVPHEPEKLITLMGGPERFVDRLDSLFTMQLDEKYIEQTEDITRDGIIGNYVHGNEPGHHIPYLYNFASAPAKTQERVRMIMETMYGTGPDGLCGNDDAGQMSAWYVFSALGFYPVCPGSDRYVLGSPGLVSAEIILNNGNTFRIRTENQERDHYIVDRITLNGQPIDRHYILHEEIMEGGELTFHLR